MCRNLVIEYRYRSRSGLKASIPQGYKVAIVIDVILGNEKVETMAETQSGVANLSERVVRRGRGSPSAVVGSLHS